MAPERQSVTVEAEWAGDGDDRPQRPRARPQAGRAPAAELPSEVDDLIVLLEATDWSRVPGVSATTAAMFCRLLCEAGGDDRGR